MRKKNFIGWTIMRYETGVVHCVIYMVMHCCSPSTGAGAAWQPCSAADRESPTALCCGR